MEPRIVKERYASGALSETNHYYYYDQWQMLDGRAELSGAEDADPIVLIPTIQRGKWCSMWFRSMCFALNEHTNASRLRNHPSLSSPLYREAHLIALTGRNSRFGMSGCLVSLSAWPN
jgi:hypothetical protein